VCDPAEDLGLARSQPAPAAGAAAEVGVPVHPDQMGAEQR
jgi:hypothetical protein